MRLNRIEHALLHNPVRPFIQSHLEARQLLRLGGPLKGGQALEIGCGMGYGIRLILDKFQAARVDAFDIDSRSVVAAARHPDLAEYKVRLWVGNARHIPVLDESYDAVFDFGAIHHIRSWRAALSEIFRVIKPGGRFYCEEIMKRYITHPLLRRILVHPQHDRFNEFELYEALSDTGFVVKNSYGLFGLYTWIIADKPH